MTIAAMPEREAHAAVFRGGEILLEAMMDHDAAHWLPLLCPLGGRALEALGFGLDFSECAATGVKYDLDLYFAPHGPRRVARWRGDLCQPAVRASQVPAGWRGSAPSAEKWSPGWR
jgi:recombinational DNA repair protein (RecF pathway)